MVHNVCSFVLESTFTFIGSCARVLPLELWDHLVLKYALPSWPHESLRLDIIKVVYLIMLKVYHIWSKQPPSRKCIRPRCHSPSHSSATQSNRRCPGPWGRWGSPGCASHWARPSSSQTLKKVMSKLEKKETDNLPLNLCACGVPLPVSPVVFAVGSHAGCSNPPLSVPPW